MSTDLNAHAMGLLVFAKGIYPTISIALKTAIIFS